MELTEDPIPKLIPKIAVPFALGMIFNTMFNVTDTFFAGRLSTDSLAALSLSFPIFFLIIGPGLGIQTGAAALISNSIGEKNTRAAVRYQVQAITLGFFAVLVVTAVLFPLLPSLYRFFGAEGEVLAGGLRYMRVIVGGSFFVIGAQVLNAGLVARGDTTAFRNVLIAMAILNVALDPVLMFGVTVAGTQIVPALRETGTAIATIFLQGVGMVYLIGRGIRGGVYAGAKLRDYLPDRAALRDLIGQSIPATLDLMILTLGTFVITYFVADFGRDAIAAYGASLRIEQIALLPLFGISTALATLVGQNNGAGRLDRVEESFRVSIRFSLIAAVAILVPVLLAAPTLLRLFTDTADVVSIGRRYLYIQGITYFSYILMNLSNSVLRGLKKPVMIMWVGLYRQLFAPLIVFPLLAYTFALRVDGVFWGLVIVNWSAAVFSYVWTRKRLADARVAA
ncbi:MAG: MATE family efflux transporter [Spirochaetaceae bacterium]|nr:MAG: MATE family efflux transporter [Spirochaetaceae bacterium]